MEQKLAWLATRAHGIVDREELLAAGVTVKEITRHFGATSIEPVPVAHDWQDGFLFAFWRRPEAYLDPLVRANISVFSRLSEAEVADFVTRLRADLDSGAWARRNAEVLAAEELDGGYRLLVAECADAQSD